MDFQSLVLSKEQSDFFNELQRKATSAECAVRYWDAIGEVDIEDLARQVKRQVDLKVMVSKEISGTNEQASSPGRNRDYRSGFKNG